MQLRKIGKVSKLWFRTKNKIIHSTKLRGRERERENMTAEEIMNPIIQKAKQVFPHV